MWRMRTFVYLLLFTIFVVTLNITMLFIIPSIIALLLKHFVFGSSNFSCPITAPAQPELPFVTCLSHSCRPILRALVIATVLTFVDYPCSVRRCSFEQYLELDPLDYFQAKTRSDFTRTIYWLCPKLSHVFQVLLSPAATKPTSSFAICLHFLQLRASLLAKSVFDVLSEFTSVQLPADCKRQFCRCSVPFRKCLWL
ncbi:hypothetical protein BDR07DRAFT_686823 [Suillus spraguei]|nr:hypothetical protein BDR07DRAFT_686823 [Suillus spraguei]